MRKFYIIKHNPNIPSDAITALNLGANALEPDITWDSFNGHPDFYIYDSDWPNNPPAIIYTLAQYCT